MWTHNHRLVKYMYKKCTCLCVDAMLACRLCLIHINSYSWTSCLFSTLNTIKEIHKESLKQWTFNTHTIASKLKKIREMLLTTLEHNQHDVI